MRKEKSKWLLMAVGGAIEPWVAKVEITDELMAQILKLRQLFLLSESFELNLSEIAARNISATYYQPKVIYDGSYEIMQKEPRFKPSDEQRTSCDEMIVNGEEVWWRCFDHYDESSGVINTERVRIANLEAALKES